ncbi:MAG: tRNA(Ile)-lysidine synthase [Pirellulaceae bacterium]|jgi:tRNA(Ile)-lysidine synthase
MSLHPFEQHVHAKWPSGAWDVTALIGVSGGADSVAMLTALCNIRPADAQGRLIVTHFNHQLRGQAAEIDAEFVRTLSNQLGLTAEIGTADNLPLSSDEESLRNARYAFFRQTADRCGARYVALAHTADDQVETILHRIIRGTGLAGLAGIPRIRRLSHAASVIRPLLDMTRAEIVAYLQNRGQMYCTDASNIDPKYTRNRIRHQLLPAIEESFNPQAREAILRLGATACEAQQFIETHVAVITKQALVDSSPTQLRLSRSPLAQAPPMLVREFFRAMWQLQNWPQQAMTQSHWENLAELAKSDSPRQFFPGGLQVESQQEFITIKMSDKG